MCADINLDEDIPHKVVILQSVQVGFMIDKEHDPRLARKFPELGEFAQRQRHAVQYLTSRSVSCGG